MFPLLHPRLFLAGSILLHRNGFRLSLMMLLENVGQNILLFSLYKLYSFIHEHFTYYSTYMPRWVIHSKFRFVLWTKPYSVQRPTSEFNLDFFRLDIIQFGSWPTLKFDPQLSMIDFSSALERYWKYPLFLGFDSIRFVMHLSLDSVRDRHWFVTFYGTYKAFPLYSNRLMTEIGFPFTIIYNRKCCIVMSAKKVAAHNWDESRLRTVLLWALQSHSFYSKFDYFNP